MVCKSICPINNHILILVMGKTVTTHLIGGKSKRAQFVFISKMGNSIKLND